jgi:hypothetical protein
MQDQLHEDAPETDQSFDPPYTFKQFTREEAMALFEEIAQMHLGISGDEFRERWHRGDYDEDPDRFEVMSVAMALPLVERQKVV